MRHDIVAKEVKVEVKEEHNYSQTNRVEIDENFTVKFEEEVKTKNEDPSFDVKSMTIGDIEKLLQSQAREIKALNLKNKSKTTEVEVCRTIISSKCLENDMMKRKLNDLTKETTDLNTKVEKLRIICKGLAKQDTNKRDHIEKLKNVCRRLRDAYQKSHKEAEDCEAKCNVLLQEKEKLCSEKQDFINVNQNLKRKIDHVSEEKNEMKEKILRLIDENI